MNDDYRWVLHLIDQCYGAATNDDHWSNLLKDIGQFLDGHGTTLFFTDGQQRPVDRFFSDNISPESIRDYQAHFHTVDIRMQRAIPAALNTVATDRDLVDQAICERHEFYQDFLRPIGHRYIVTAVLDLDDGLHAFCSSHRGLKQDHAESDIVDRARLIMPHIRRALQLRNRLSVIDARCRAAFDVLDGLGQAVFLMDAKGCILWQNILAGHLLDRKDGLITSDGELRALSTTASTELQQLVKSAIDTSSQPRARPGGMMTVPRPSLKRAYQILVTPLGGTPEMNVAFRSHGVSPAAAVFILDLDQRPVPKADVLRTLYNLTPAEARLATALGSGISIKAYAERAKLSIHYVRWLLKQVEAKTDTHRMTDLMQLLARQTGLFGAGLTNGKRKEK